MKNRFEALHWWKCFWKTIGFSFYLLKSLTFRDWKSASLLPTPGKYSAVTMIPFFSNFSQMSLLNSDKILFCLLPNPLSLSFWSDVTRHLCCLFAHGLISHKDSTGWKSIFHTFLLSHFRSFLMKSTDPLLCVIPDSKHPCLSNMDLELLLTEVDLILVYFFYFRGYFEPTSSVLPFPPLLFIFYELFIN